MLADIAKNMLSYDPQSRPTAKQIVESLIKEGQNERINELVSEIKVIKIIITIILISI